MKIIISGASGLVGSALTDAFRAEGYRVSHLVRPGAHSQPSASQEIPWDPQSARLEVSGLEGADVVVNLSGASIGARRWTAARKQVLRSSRLDSTRVLVDALAQVRAKPQVFVSASAVGYYGNRGDQILTESSEGGTDFLSLLAQDWEAQANRATQAGIRTVILRMGVILSDRGGALGQMLRPFRFGLGGRLGSGRQWLSWIAIEDVVRIVRLVIDRSDLHGPLNAVAPEPVRNADFARIVGRLLDRPAVFPAPEFALRLALGELAGALLLTSQRAMPERLLAANYAFGFGSLETTLRSRLLTR